MPEIQVKDKLITLEELGTAYNNSVKKTGDTMTGPLTLDHADRSGRSIRFYANGTQTGWISTDNQTNVMQFLQINPNVAGSFGLYQLPAADENPYGFYNILTTKSPVLVTQGGTGATTPADARANLEITPANIGAFSGGSSTKILKTTIAANSSIDVTLSVNVQNYTVLVLGDNHYDNPNREGFDGRSNIHFFPKAMSASNQFSYLVPPNNSWMAWFPSPTSLHVANATSNVMSFRIDGFN